MKEALWKPSGQGGDLVPVHGGLAEPVDRVVPLSERAKLLREAESLPSLRVTRAELSTVHRIADGALSPLTGPMDGETWHRVLDEQRILVSGRPYAWTIPLSLPATEAEAAALSRGGSVALRDEAGVVVGIVDGVEVFEWGKPKYAKRVYRTDRLDHPGGRI
jgi:sulfate adenylyltransferase